MDKKKKIIILAGLILVPVILYMTFLTLKNTKIITELKIGEGVVLTTKGNIYKKYECNPYYIYKIKDFPIYITELCVDCELRNIDNITYVEIPDYVVDTFNIEKLLKLNQNIDIDESKEYVLQFRHINVSNTKWAIEECNLYYRVGEGYNSSWVNVIDCSLYKTTLYVDDPTEYEITGNLSRITISNQNDIAEKYYRVWQSMCL